MKKLGKGFVNLKDQKLPGCEQDKGSGACESGIFFALPTENVKGQTTPDGSGLKLKIFVELMSLWVD